jgi:LysR family transcriptional regulator, hca operon transcriptional activator
MQSPGRRSVAPNRRCIRPLPISALRLPPGSQHIKRSAGLELRHLRYFLAVAEAGSLTVAAERTLHTSQPSLSRQIQNLENEVGVPLFRRSARGVELTASGQAFMEHTRLVLSHVAAATNAARQVVRPTKPCFTIGFLTGYELTWMAETLQILRDELPNIDVMISSHTSSQLAMDLVKGQVDAAFLRRERGLPELEFKPLLQEPLVVVLSSDHQLAARAAIDPRDLVGETFLGISEGAPVLRALVDDYLRRSRVELSPEHQIDNLAMAMSLIVSTGGVALLPAYAQSFLPWSITSRPLQGDPPVIDLVIGYKKGNESPILELLLSRCDELIARVANHPH